MDRLLKRDERETLAQVFGQNRLYQAVKLAFCTKMTGLKTFEFTPEDVWNFTAVCFDRIIGAYLPFAGNGIGPDLRRWDADSGYAPLLDCLWENVHADIRQAVRQQIPAFTDNGADVPVATAMVVACVARCVFSLDTEACERITRKVKEVAQVDFLHQFSFPLLRRCGVGLDEQLSRYVGEGYAQGERWSQWDKKTKLSVSSAYAPPVNAGVLKGAIERHFRGCFLPEGKAPVVAPADFERLVRAADYLVDNGRPLALEKRIRTAEGTTRAKVRYDVYLVYEKIFKQKKGMLPLLAEFLIHTFDIFQNDTVDNIRKHFAEQPDKPRKKKAGRIVKTLTGG